MNQALAVNHGFSEANVQLIVAPRQWTMFHAQFLDDQSARCVSQPSAVTLKRYCYQKVVPG
jgi:hypothetical protein